MKCFHRILLFGLLLLFSMPVFAHSTCHTGFMNLSLSAQSAILTDIKYVKNDTAEIKSEKTFVQMAVDERSNDQHSENSNNCAAEHQIKAGLDYLDRRKPREPGLFVLASIVLDKPKLDPLI